MARINPSPDWFMGVDSFQLCVEGNWVDTVTVELDPLDGGTDNGFTFTAANWPTQPQGIAYRITSRYPAHPAGSFYYPNLSRLPPIATLTFTKLPIMVSNRLSASAAEVRVPIERNTSNDRERAEKKEEETRYGLKKGKCMLEQPQITSTSYYTLRSSCFPSERHSIESSKEVETKLLVDKLFPLYEKLRDKLVNNELGISKCFLACSSSVCRERPLREYTLTETYHEDDVEVEFVSNDNLLANSPTPRGTDPNRELNEAIAEERKEMDTQRYRYWTTTGSGQVVTDVPRDNKAAIMDSIASSYALQRPRLPPTPSPKVQKFDSKTGWPYYQKYKQTAEAQKAQIFEDIQRKMANATSGNSLGHSWNSTDITTQRQHRLRMKHHRLTSKGKRLRTRPPRDCKVGEWGPWSACSRSCGVGETQRTRKITIKPRRGGLSCPPLKETKWCGSINPCSDGKSIVDSLQW
ncbi:Spondin-2 [Habropoda laboriosa]|uniref:Spondin-2 n=1 Tax=Habropoda laboriosa TaxID=597456 RepID=A0A0L7QYN7_9HYME|nr:Spondin-2 [Habropoda laboriosa]